MRSCFARHAYCSTTCRASRLCRKWIRGGGRTMSPSTEGILYGDRHGCVWHLPGSRLVRANARGAAGQPGSATATSQRFFPIAIGRHATSQRKSIRKLLKALQRAPARGRDWRRAGMARRHRCARYSRNRTDRCRRSSGRRTRRCGRRGRDGRSRGWPDRCGHSRDRSEAICRPHPRRGVSDLRALRRQQVGEERRGDPRSHRRPRRRQNVGVERRLSAFSTAERSSISNSQHPSSQESGAWGFGVGVGVYTRWS